MLVPPPLPELGLDGGRPAAASLGAAGAVIRLGARVVAIAGAAPLIETAHGRALLHGAPALRPSADLTLELQHADPALACTGRLVAVGQQRLEPALPVRLQPVPPTQAAATVQSAATLEVSVRALGPDGRPLMPVFAARLGVPWPEPAPVLPGRSVGIASTSAAAAGRGSVVPNASMPAEIILPVKPATLAMTDRAGVAPPAPPAAPTAPTATARVPAPTAQINTPEQARVLAAHGQPLEVVVLRRDALDRVLLRGAGTTFEVDPPVQLPVGARLQLTLAAGLARSSAAPLQAGPLEAVRTLRSLLRVQAGREEPPAAATPRLPQPTATLAARLLRLVQLIAQHSGEAIVKGAAAAAGAEAQPGTARATLALAELGRLAGEPHSGGWRVFLLPLGFEGAPMLRLYVREDADQDEGGKNREPAPSSRRAVFELEFDKLGRCQLDVLCQARRLDLIVRTEQPLDPQARRAIRELYVAARDTAGLLGELRFRAGEWASVPEPTGPGGPGGLTV